MKEFTTPLAWRRRPTPVVRVGELGIGGGEPVRIQSMLTCATHDVEGVLAEMRGLIEAGCEIVRLAIPTKKELEALPLIRRRMREEGLRAPLAADIHFNPALALAVLPHVEKLRINPGNFADQKRFQVRDYSDAQYAAELERVGEALAPLAAGLRKHGRALRVGVNHGSLSDRIINRHGDTPRGMAESALEYLRLLAGGGFGDIVVSLKSSNPLVAIQANRLLRQEMEAEGLEFPLHLGVTEAGEGQAGRLKSAVGIGALLCDGLGDTLRVSLTEPPAAEILPARELAAIAGALAEGPSWPGLLHRAPLGFSRRPTCGVALAAGALAAGAMADCTVGGGAPVRLLGVGGERAGPAIGGDGFDGVLRPLGEGVTDPAWPGLALPEHVAGEGPPPAVLLRAGEIDGAQARALLERAGEFPGGALLVVSGARLLQPVRRLAGMLRERGLDWPMGVLPTSAGQGAAPLITAAEIGCLAADGLLDALICLEDGPAALYCRALLQAARLRSYEADYISCPSCGRTLFDIQQTTAGIRSRTAHLKGVRIGVMGCIVNGPGEMADADFGYVGGAPGKVSLYHGQKCVERGIPESQAVERLVALIKQEGRWVEPTAE